MCLYLCVSICICIYVCRHTHTLFFLRLPTTVLFSLLESSRCKDEEMSVQVVDRKSRDEKWEKTAWVLDSVCVGWVGMCSTGERGKEKGGCKEMLNNNSYYSKLNGENNMRVIVWTDFEHGGVEEEVPETNRAHFVTFLIFHLWHLPRGTASSRAWDTGVSAVL